MYKNNLLPPLLFVFQEAVEVGHLFNSMREAIIVLLLKPVIIRPVSLLHVDLKLLDKILANRFSTIITEVVHENQTSFTLKLILEDFWESPNELRVYWK